MSFAIPADAERRRAFLLAGEVAKGCYPISVDGENASAIPPLRNGVPIFGLVGLDQSIESARMTEPDVRKGMPFVKLSREEFESRYRS